MRKYTHFFLPSYLLSCFFLKKRGGQARKGNLSGGWNPHSRQRFINTGAVYINTGPVYINRGGVYKKHQTLAKAKLSTKISTLQNN